MSNDGDFSGAEDRLRGLKTRMEHYDSLPADYRQVLQEAPYNLHIKPVKGLPRLQLLKEQIQAAMKKSIISTYGEGHPDLEKLHV